MKWCGYEWIDDAGDLHLCGQRGSHDVHHCADDDCEATLPAASGGGRWRRGTQPTAGRPKSELVAGVRHGTATTYKKKHCRCTPCRAAHAEELAAWRERRKAQT